MPKKLNPRAGQLSLLPVTHWLVWSSGNGVGYTNKVRLCQAQLVLGLVTTSGGSTMAVRAFSASITCNMPANHSILPAGDCRQATCYVNSKIFSQQEGESGNEFTFLRRRSRFCRLLSRAASLSCDFSTSVIFASRSWLVASQMAFSFRNLAR